MTPMIASAAQMPVKDNEFDVILASDVLEHVPPDLRKMVIDESLRVARKLVIFGFPCGELAWESDRALLDAYLKKNLTPAEWLTEHMEAKFPEPELFREIDGWEIQHHDNENISFHSWLMRSEMSRVFLKVSSTSMRLAPFLVEMLLRRANRRPVYRKIFVLRKLTT
ncbi:MAG: methyltransferase domain-containing protein [Edaphobacter sp.]